MTYTEYQQYMQNFFEQYYQKISKDEQAVTLPLGDKEREMWSDDAAPNEERKKWKIVPARIADSEIESLEEEIGTKLPLSLKAFLTVYHHCFEPPIGRNPISKHFDRL